jgi:hypothetical protein
MKTFDCNQDAPAQFAASGGSAESDLWHEYLQSCGHSGYEGLCKCYRCQSVRDRFPKWKEERDRMQPNDKLTPLPPGHCSATCACIGGHVFAYAGHPPDGRIPEGWVCGCGQTVAHWQKCNLGHEHLVAVSPNARVSDAADKPKAQHG